MRGSDSFAAKYGRWAVIVGASEGIGAAYAEEIAACGLNLVLVARRADKLRARAEDITSRFAVACRTLCADVGTDAGVDRILEEAKSVDAGLLVYNAAFAPAAPFLDLPRADHLQVITVNSRNMLSVVHAEAGRMVTRGRGGIIIMCSMAGFQGLPGIATYAASKAFNIAISEALYVELKPQRVDVLGCVAGATSTPGFASTMRPVKPVPASAGGVAPNGDGGSLDSSDGFPFWVMAPRGVARAGLRALGRAPLVVTGGVNRFAVFFFRHFFSRRSVVRFMGKASGPID